MPKYEAIILAKLCNAEPAAIKEAHKRLLRQVATRILDDGGVVRSFESLGHDQELPYRIKKYQEIYSRASTYSVVFDISPRSLPKIRQQLSFDEDILRATILKLGDSIDKVASYVPPENL